MKLISPQFIRPFVNLGWRQNYRRRCQGNHDLLQPPAFHECLQSVTTENRNDLGLLYNSLPAWEKGVLIAKEAVESASIGGAIGGKISVASIVGKNKQSYQPNKGAVSDMRELFKQSGFGDQIKSGTLKTTQYRM
ncbi:hypothetical protein [Photorhabdus sp. SF281]|uniref:hypothetical protein n=1 Tax=Photorhabdus sp. SF281 TaxID=3459527 RepID=UPI004044814C